MKKKSKAYITHEEYLSTMPPEVQARIKERAKKFVEIELTLQELRKSLGISQTTVAEVLELSQGDVSKFERREDTYISTLRRYIEALGGKLELVAKFPNSKPVKIAHIGDLLDGEYFEKHG